MHILIKKSLVSKAHAFDLSGRAIQVSIGLFLAILLFGLIAIGYFLGHTQVSGQLAEVEAQGKAALIEADVTLSKKVGDMRVKAQDQLDMLGSRVARLQAQVVRLNSVGERMAKIAKLDESEFSFSSEPPMGGPVDSETSKDLDVPDFLLELQLLEELLAEGDHNLGLLSHLIVTEQHRPEYVPAGYPVKKGWISSYYGKRTDPITGKREWHKGIDVAAREGSDILATASGVVVWAGKKWGYGNIVEIDHGDITSRYAHNKKNLVKRGDFVTQGQKIAILGSTGRSTGPHVHFELIKNKKSVNPLRHIKTKRIKRTE